MEDLELLKESLIQYKDKWNDEIDKIKEEGKDVGLHIQRNAMVYMAQWIINSINGGINKPHSTNICNNVLKDE